MSAGAKSPAKPSRSKSPKREQALVVQASDEGSVDEGRIFDTIEEFTKDLTELSERELENLMRDLGEEAAKCYRTGDIETALQKFCKSLAAFDMPNAPLKDAGTKASIMCNVGSCLHHTMFGSSAKAARFAAR